MNFGQKCYGLQVSNTF